MVKMLSTEWNGRSRTARKNKTETVSMGIPRFGSLFGIEGKANTKYWFNSVDLMNVTYFILDTWTTAIHPAGLGRQQATNKCLWWYFKNNLLVKMLILCRLLPFEWKIRSTFRFPTFRSIRRVFSAYRRDEKKISKKFPTSERIRSVPVPWAENILWTRALFASSSLARSALSPGITFDSVSGEIKHLKSIVERIN